MHPSIELDLHRIERNLQAWQAFTGLPVRAVVKSDGYNWGARRIVAALDRVAAGFCVGDADELFALRGATKKPVVVLASVDPSLLAAVLDFGGIPTIADDAELERVVAWGAARGRVPLVRVGVSPVAGWSGVTLDALRSFAPSLARAGVQVEPWTHVTDPDAADSQVAAYRRAVEILGAAGVALAGGDVAATAAAAAGHVVGERTRLGAGLFGAGRATVPGLRCAVTVRAPIVRTERVSAGARVGYGNVALAADASIAVARCGYADGFANVGKGMDDIFSVGMQYVTVPIERADADGSVRLIDEDTDLDRFADVARRSVHEVITNLGLASRIRGER
ncbi:MAG TPA: alanine racemase [Verrucomicrobiae bacterium]|nr:alanine racemase [Verrucomicrobiae bacterium]